MSGHDERFTFGGNVIGNNFFGGSNNTGGPVRVGETGSAEASGSGSPAPAAGLTPRLAFALDAIRFTDREPMLRDNLSKRLRDLVDGLLADLGVAKGAADDGGFGDGIKVCLPPGLDPTVTMPDLINSLVQRLRRDNNLYRDRIRLRMAVGFGSVGDGPLGFIGPLVIELARLVDSPALRHACDANPDSDLVVLVSSGLHDDVIRPGYVRDTLGAFRSVRVKVKNFSAPAWLWLSAPARYT